jgi:DinB superfamily
MAVERCDECGYDADDWSDSSAVTAIEGLPARWHEAIAGLPSGELHRRPIPAMWSIAEHADHVREVLFGMRFLLDTALTTPGADLGESLSSRFDPEPRRIEVKMALAGIEREATALRERLAQLSPDQWNLAVKLDGMMSTRTGLHDTWCMTPPITLATSQIFGPPSDRLRVSKSRGRDGDPCLLSGQRSSLPFATQITKWASRTASRVARDTPASASAAALALSPACSSSITATRSSSDAAALSAFFANSLTTATSTGEAPSSLSTASRALSILTRAASSRSAVVVTGEGYVRRGRDVPDRRPGTPR